jgi:pimeloyl-ACP methyl ester carboxylesterase
MNVAFINGAKLGYWNSGGGAQSMLFVHGWACDHATLMPVMEHFRPSYRVVAVDLRGHGISDKPYQEYTVAGFADDLASLCRELEIQRPVVIGHSMGGTVALDLGARYSDLVSGIVLIDSVVFPDNAFLKALQPFARALYGEDYREALRQTASSLFLSTDDSERKSRLLSTMADVPQHVLASAFRNHITEYDATQAASTCRLPVAYIAAARKLADLDRFRELCPQLIVTQTLGAEHFSPLEVPDQVNAMIERFCFCVRFPSISAGPPNLSQPSTKYSHWRIQYDHGTSRRHKTRSLSAD